MECLSNGISYDFASEKRDLTMIHQHPLSEGTSSLTANSYSPYSHGWTRNKNFLSLMHLCSILWLISLAIIHHHFWSVLLTSTTIANESSWQRVKRESEKIVTKPKPWGGYSESPKWVLYQKKKKKNHFTCIYKRRINEKN